MQENLKSNIWKFFLLILTNRRNYIPVLSIYFLTLPNATANQIGLYTGIGWLMGFLFEIPSGYFSDNFGHKKTLILAKIFMLASTLCFIFGTKLIHFIFGSSFIALGFAFTSGTAGALLHNTLIGLKRDKEYASISGKNRAKASLVSAGMILLLPLLTKVSLLTPIKIYLIFDVLGILTAISLITPKMKYSAEDLEGEKIWSQLKRFKGTGFYISSIFVGLIGGFVMGMAPYKELFAISLGFPIVFVGSIMALSRIIWFVVGHNLHILKKIPIKKLFLCEIFFFSATIILASQIKNPYIASFLLASIAGYYFGRSAIISEYFLDNFVINKRYKATMSSIKAQIGKLFESGIVFAMGFLMAISYKLGFLVWGISMLVVLLAIYPFLKKVLK
ncbi:MFS transporter [Candidatus Woesearchaeota archaeon]|nr:MFS transporter [Candidatus Woesearchaeota archaeon]